MTLSFNPATTLLLLSCDRGAQHRRPSPSNMAPNIHQLQLLGHNIDGWSTYMGRIAFYIGIGCYLWMIIASFWRLCHRSNGKTARRFLLPYSVINFILSSIFVISIIVAEGLLQIDPKSSAERYESLACSPLNMTVVVTLGLLILFNDALFLYRVGTLYHWQVRPLVVPAALYLACAISSVLLSVSSGCDADRMSRMAGALNQGQLICTAVLNTVLACMIAFKLVKARKNALLLDVRHMASYFSFTARIIVESAAAWTLSIIIVLAFSSPLMPVLPQTMFPLFDDLFKITSMLSPAALLYRITHFEHDIPCVSPTQQSSNHPCNPADQNEGKITLHVRFDKAACRPLEHSITSLVSGTGEFMVDLTPMPPSIAADHFHATNSREHYSPRVSSLHPQSLLPSRRDTVIDICSPPQWAGRIVDHERV